MKKFVSTFLAVVIAAVSLFCGAFSANAAIYQPDVELYSKAYMLINLDDDSYPVVAQKNQDEKMYPASLTKIVTAIVTLNNVSDLQEQVTVSEAAFNILLGTGAQVAGLEIGDTLTVEQLLYLNMVHSACDASEVLAEYVGGTRENFVKMMNDYAASLGCTGTNFMNPDGLHDPNHYTTAADLAKITLDALKNSTFTKIAYTVEYEYNGMNYYNTNLMLRRGYLSYYYEYAKGIKTGSTSEAGYCVITTASKDGYNYLAIVLGAPVIDYNHDGYVEKCSFIDAATLFKWAFGSLKYSTIIEQNEVLDEIPVENGKDADTLRLVAKEDVTAIVPNGLDRSNVVIKAKDKPESVDAPIEKGDAVCTAQIIYADQVVAEVQLVAADTVELSTFLTILNAIKHFFSLTAVQIIIALIVVGIAVYIGLFIYKANKKKTKRRSQQDGEE